jgi:hypothetical protein
MVGGGAAAAAIANISEVFMVDDPYPVPIELMDVTDEARLTPEYAEGIGTGNPPIPCGATDPGGIAIPPILSMPPKAPDAFGSASIERPSSFFVESNDAWSV